MTVWQILSRALLVLVVAAVAGGAAYYFSDSQEREYGATTRLLFSGSTPELRAVGVSDGGDDDERAVANNILQVGSFDIARRTAEALDDPAYDADEVAASVKAEGERGSDVIQLTATAPSAAEAADLVGVYRREFILRSREVVRSRARRARLVLDDSLDQLSPRVRQGQRGDAIRSHMAALMLVERTGGEPLIVQGVRAFEDPVTPHVFRDTLFGVLFGAVLGIGLVALRGATRSPRHEDDDAPPAIAQGPTDASRRAA